MTNNVSTNTYSAAFVRCWQSVPYQQKGLICALALIALGVYLLYTSVEVTVTPTFRVTRGGIRGASKLLDDKFKADREPEIQKALKIVHEVVSQARESPVIYNCDYKPLPIDPHIGLLMLIHKELALSQCTKSPADDLITSAKLVYLLYFFCRLAMDELPKHNLDGAAFKNPDFYGTPSLTGFFNHVEYVRDPTKKRLSVFAASEQEADIVDLTTIVWLKQDLQNRVQALPGWI
jgi:hypothetical protein